MSIKGWMHKEAVVPIYNGIPLRHKNEQDSAIYRDMAEKAMAPHSSTLAWKIPWMKEPGRLQSMRFLRVGHDWATSFHFSLPCIGEGNGNPLQCSCLENPRDGGAWWAALYGVAQSRTRLKQLSSSSSSNIPLCICTTDFLSIHLMMDI